MRGAHLLGIHAQLFAQAQALIVGGDAGPQNEVVDHLAHLPGAGRTEMENIRCEAGKGRAAGLERRFLARTQDQQLAADRRLLAAR